MHNFFRYSLSLCFELNMSEEKKRGEDTEDGGPGLVYMPFVVNEELLDKLRLLNYEQEFSKPLNMKSMSR